MITMMRGVVAGTFALTTVAILAGCPSGSPLAPTGPKPTNANGSTCDRTSPEGTPSTGATIHGRYAGQKLPMDWAVQHKSEAEITAAIKGQETTVNWACFQTFYPATTDIYKSMPK